MTVDFGSDRKAPDSDRLPDSSEQIEGSDQPDGASAESVESARRLDYHDGIESILRDRVEEYSDRCDNKHGPLDIGEAKAVFHRGLGAYSSQHSPEVESRVRWGLARLDQYMRLRCNGEPRNPDYVQDNDLLPSSHPESSRDDG